MKKEKSVPTEHRSRKPREIGLPAAKRKPAARTGQQARHIGKDDRVRKGRKICIEKKEKIFRIFNISKDFWKTQSEGREKEGWETQTAAAFC